MRFLTAIKTVRKSVMATTLVACSFGVAAQPVRADTSLTISSLTGHYSDEDHATYGYLAREVVESLDSVASGLTRWGHNRLGLSQSSRWRRSAYLISAIHLQLRMQWANSLYFGHEFSHFATAHQFGREEHYFRDGKSGEEIPFLRAYARAMWQGSVGGPAVSRRPAGSIASQEEITSTAAGLNWQMNYSERWLRQHIAFGHKDFFNAPEFLLNRSYLMSYALGDSNRDTADMGKQNEDRGDLIKWAEHIERTQSDSDVLDKVVANTVLANLLSPAFWTAINSFNSYVESGETGFSVPVIETGIGQFAWDIPQYLNFDSMTLAPTVYWRMDDRIADFVGANRIVLAAATEIPVIGDGKGEQHLSMTGRWGRFDADLGFSRSGSGHFTEFEMAYRLKDRLAVTGGVAISDGKTLRGRRNYPFGNHATWLGLRLSF